MGSIQPRAIMPSSGVTTSDTPSTISSTPTGDDSNIGFTAHTPDFEADVTDSNAGYGYQPVRVLSFLVIWIGVECAVLCFRYLSVRIQCTIITRKLTNSRVLP